VCRWVSRRVHQIAQKAFYALEEMGQLETLHTASSLPFTCRAGACCTEKAYADFVAANGGDAAKFSEAFRGFSVNTKANRARQLSEAYKIDGVPALGHPGPVLHFRLAGRRACARAGRRRLPDQSAPARAG
jgi:hypothetical protein